MQHETITTKGGLTATLYLADCMDVLPTLDKVDAVITDPPYGIGYKSGPNSPNSISSTGKRFSHIGIIGDNRPFDPEPWLRFNAVAFTGAQHFYERLPEGTLHCWNKRGDYKPLCQADADFLWVKGRRRASRVFHLAWRGICRHSENTVAIEHPTQKPLQVMRWAIENAGVTCGQTILDPFMGSGTTGVAALRRGCNFIGVELEPKYYDIAKRRIKAEAAQGDLFRA